VVNAKASEQNNVAFNNPKNIGSSRNTFEAEFAARF